MAHEPEPSEDLWTCTIGPDRAQVIDVARRTGEHEVETDGLWERSATIADDSESIGEQLIELLNPPHRVVREYRDAGLAELRLVAKHSMTFAQAGYVLTRVAVMQTRAAVDKHRTKDLIEGLHDFVRAIISISRSTALEATLQADLARFAGELCTVTRVRPRLRVLVNRRVDETKSLIAPGVYAIDQDLRKQFTIALRRIVSPSDADVLSTLPTASSPPSDSTSDLLIRSKSSAPSRSRDDSPAPDLSMANVRISSVTMANFRGAPQPITLAFTQKSGKAVSSLIYGDNGVGKSTIVDAIEMALQARLGRDSDFDSTQSSAVRNIASADLPTAMVELDDATTCSRTIERSESGRTVAVGTPLAAGFLWAPIALKRSDIVRFLSTDALSRGTILFDYFPAQASSMGEHPEQELRRLEERRFQLRVRRRALASELSSIIDVPTEELEARDQFIHHVRAKLLGGKTILEATEDGTWGELDEHKRDLIQHHLGTLNALSNLKKRLERGIEVLNPVAYARQASSLRETVARVGEELTQSFLRITGVSHIDRIEVLAGASGPISLDIVVIFKNGVTAFPQQIFSEGYQDLLALLFFLAVSRVATKSGQARILVLDDVFQSVDLGIRMSVMRYVLDMFADWQLILTIHDRLWLEQLRALFRRRGHAFVETRITGWSFGHGPELMDGGQNARSAIAAAIDSADITSACANSGRLLEQIAGEESGRMRVSIQRTVDDKYTLGDLWPALKKSFRRSLLADLMTEIDDTMELRNLAGAHYNAWADVLSWGEAKSFAQSVLELHENTYCTDCADWLALQTGGASAACRCGRLNISLR